MGLKLYHLDANGARGELDGQPFTLEAHDAGWKAVIGENDKVWMKENFEPTMVKESFLLSKGRRAISDIRNMTYHAVAVYRQTQRVGA